jgi:inorganic pyrophosphatase
MFRSSAFERVRCHALLATVAFIYVGIARPMAADNIVATAQPKEAPAEVMAVIEIPQGSFTKYELDPATGHLIVNRFQSMPVAYPANYGSVTATSAGDGDPLDVIVYSREPIVPGALIRVRPVGVLRMLDNGEQDDKIVAVPTAKVDPTYDRIQDVNDLPQAERDRLVAFFRVYKDLPKSGKKVELGGLEGADTARKLIQDAMKAYGAR